MKVLIFLLKALVGGAWKCCCCGSGMSPSVVYTLSSLIDTVSKSDGAVWPASDDFLLVSFLKKVLAREGFRLPFD